MGGAGERAALPREGAVASLGTVRLGQAFTLHSCLHHISVCPCCVHMVWRAVSTHMCTLPDKPNILRILTISPSVLTLGGAHFD